MDTDPTTEPRYGADELAIAAGLPRRTIRYYIQLGLVDRPTGETRAAHYGWRHLSQLLRIRELSEQGLSLEAIRTRLQSADQPAAAPAPPPGTLQVKTHLTLAPGVELIVDPTVAGLSPDALRQLAREIVAACRRLPPSNKEET
jgi:DNA-binding transcriptional MerR regulator